MLSPRVKVCYLVLPPRGRGLYYQEEGVSKEGVYVNYTGGGGCVIN